MTTRRHARPSRRSGRRALAAAPTFDVPEPRVLDAERALLIEELEMTWRYSVGNAYEELSFAEALDVAQVMAEFGYGDVARQILRYTLEACRAIHELARGRAPRRGRAVLSPRPRPRYVAEETPALRAVVDRLARESRQPNGLLPRERYSSDIADEIYSLQGQTLVWQGLLAMGRVWAATGTRSASRSARVLAAVLSSAACAARWRLRTSARRTDRSSFRRRSSTGTRRSRG